MEMNGDRIAKQNLFLGINKHKKILHTPFLQCWARRSSGTHFISVSACSGPTPSSIHFRKFLFCS